MRDTRKPESYLFENYNKYSKRIERQINKVDSGVLNRPERFILSIFISKVHQLVLAYSLGKTKDEMKILYQEFLDLLEKYDPHIYTENANVWIFKSYVDLLWMVCLGYLLDFSAEDLLLFKDKTIASDRNDKLISTIFHQLYNDVEILPNYLMEDPTPKLDPILEAGTNANIEDLKNYLLNDWYKAHKGLAWHNTHKNDNLPYLGYWSFESAAIVKMFNLDDTILQGVDYYPYDAAHW